MEIGQKGEMSGEMWKVGCAESPYEIIHILTNYDVTKKNNNLLASYEISGPPSQPCQSYGSKSQDICLFDSRICEWNILHSARRDEGKYPFRCPVQFAERNTIRESAY